MPRRIEACAAQSFVPVRVFVSSCHRGLDAVLCLVYKAPPYVDPLYQLPSSPFQQLEFASVCFRMENGGSQGARGPMIHAAWTASYLTQNVTKGSHCHNSKSRQAKAQHIHSIRRMKSDSMPPAISCRVFSLDLWYSLLGIPHMSFSCMVKGWSSTALIFISLYLIKLGQCINRSSRSSHLCRLRAAQDLRKRVL